MSQTLIVNPDIPICRIHYADKFEYVLKFLFIYSLILTLAGIRTSDLQSNKPIHYQLSYPGLDALKVI